MSESEVVFWGMIYAVSQTTREVFFPTNITDILPRGDLIWSREEFGDTYAYKPVIDTTRTENQQLYEVIVENKQGETKTYLTTAEHPFYIDQIGWLKASLLEADMPLLDRNGR